MSILNKILDCTLGSVKLTLIRMAVVIYDYLNFELL